MIYGPYGYKSSKIRVPQNTALCRPGYRFPPKSYPPWGNDQETNEGLGDERENKALKPFSSPFSANTGYLKAPVATPYDFGPGDELDKLRAAHVYDPNGAVGTLPENYDKTLKGAKYITEDEPWVE